jgi:YHS domain-containing protein
LGRFVAFARLYGVFAVAFVFVVVGIGLWFSQPAHASAQSRRVVVDPVSGLALWGYDPVAYHTDQKAVKGKHIYEYVWQNVSWVFASEANLEVFKADPELYAPRYGGHGALAMARGYLSGANPQVFALYKGKLYLFYSFPTRAAWVQSLPLHIQRATAHWQKLEPTLTR